MKKEQQFFSNIKSINEGNYPPSSSDSSIESGEIELKNRIDEL